MQSHDEIMPERTYYLKSLKHQNRKRGRFTLDRLLMQSLCSYACQQVLFQIRVNCDQRTALHSGTIYFSGLL